MMLSPQSFNEIQINRLFPFYILINKYLNVIALGKSLNKLCDFHKPQNINQFFSISSPQTSIKSFNDLISLQDQLIVINLSSDKNLILRGQLEYMEHTDEILFLGSPCFSSIEQIAENNLAIDDFAKNDPLVDLFYGAQNNTPKNEGFVEDEEVLAKLEKKNSLLKVENKDDYDRPLFSKQSLDPNIRIDFQGDLMHSNSAASHLEFITYEGKTYLIHLFYKLIAAIIDEKKEKWSFEGSANGKDYSFVCLAFHKEGYINMYARDVTKQKKYQQELEKLSIIVKETMNAVIITDVEGNIEWVNKAFEEFSGYTFHDIKGKSPGSFLQGKETDLETIAYMRQQIKDSKPFSCEVYNYNKTGKGYWVKLKGQPVFDENGKTINFFAIQEDITEIKINQQLLQGSEKKYRDLIDNTQVSHLQRT
ncbi:MULTISPECIES: PAS domain-containing protein [unclassified Polaribacter]|uniref:PAS domain-containing protein n=1 Tax=unclassified Polaribacter TaxID=196858 RepID=UPI0011BE7C76|nr:MULTISPECIES: PAS domain-containing protein [unclassified Polaribacter]TXD48968.1 PAS domain-containing protein [Polaribacter sp. IC063]TXD55898.1 PAS domain-containing protein [Polaribacter sp. IC066]